MTHRYIIVLLPVSARFHGNSTGPMVITLMLYVVYYTVWKASLFGAFLSLSACIWTEYRELFCNSGIILFSTKSKCRKMQTRKTPNTDTLFAELVSSFSSIFPGLNLMNILDRV